MKSILFSAAVFVSSVVLTGSAMADQSANFCIDGTDTIQINEGADLTSNDLCSSSLSYSARLVNGNLEIHRRGKRGGRCGQPVKIGQGAKMISVSRDAVLFRNNKGVTVGKFNVPKEGRGSNVRVLMRNDAALVMADTNGTIFWQTETTPADCP